MNLLPFFRNLKLTTLTLFDKIHMHIFIAIYKETLTMKLKKSGQYTITVLLALLALTLFTTGLTAQEDDTLSHEVSVSAKTIPVFAVDQNGNPVFNLEKKDIQLIINNQPTDFQFLEYEYQQEEKQEKTVQLTPKQDRRVIFIIMDTLFNSREGFEKSRKLIHQLVNVQFKGGNFVILENTSYAGLRYISGPERNSGKIIAAVDKIKWFPEKQRKQIFMSPGDSFSPLIVNYDMDNAYWYGSDPHWEKKKLRAEGKRFRNKMKQFGQSLGQFKYVLQSLNRPSLVFLLSEGVSKQKGVTTFKHKYHLDNMSFRNAYREFSLYYLTNLVQGVNSGGTVLYTVNPALVENAADIKDLDTGEKLSLRYMAQASGGKYFEGKSVESIAKDIRKYTAAYYEIGFQLKPEWGPRQSIQVKCTRPGIRIHTVRFAQQAKLYKQMNRKEKELFAYNAATGGTWSRMNGSIERAAYNIAENKETGVRTLTIAIPKDLRNKKTDVFILDYSTQTQEVQTRFSTKTLAAQEILSFQPQKGTGRFFVFIDPATGRGIVGSTRPTPAPEKKTPKQRKYYTAATSSAVMTAAGEITAAVDQDGKEGITLNGIPVHQSDNRTIGIDKLTRFTQTDVIRFKEGTQFRYIILKTDGTYAISSLYETAAPVKAVKNTLYSGDQPIKIHRTGKTPEDLKDFYLFFDRFRSDETFQRERVEFPHRRVTLDKSGNATNTVEVKNEAWEFTTFMDTEEYKWSPPSVSGSQARLRLNGPGVAVEVQFRKVNGTWSLTRSEIHSNR